MNSEEKKNDECLPRKCLSCEAIRIFGYVNLAENAAHPLKEEWDTLFTWELPVGKRAIALDHILDRNCKNCSIELFRDLIGNYEDRNENEADLFYELFSLQKKKTEKEVEKALVKVGFVSAVESGYYSK